MVTFGVIDTITLTPNGIELI